MEKEMKESSIMKMRTVKKGVFGKRYMHNSMKLGTKITSTTRQVFWSLNRS